SPPLPTEGLGFILNLLLQANLSPRLRSFSGAGVVGEMNWFPHTKMADILANCLPPLPLKPFLLMSTKQTFLLGKPALWDFLYFSFPPRPLPIHFTSTHTHTHTHTRTHDLSRYGSSSSLPGLTAAPAELYLSPGTCLSQPIRRKNLTEPTCQQNASDDSLSTVLVALQPRRERKLTIFWLSRHWETWADHWTDFSDLAAPRERRDSKLAFAAAARFLATRSHRQEGEGGRIRKLEISFPCSGAWDATYFSKLARGATEVCDIPPSLSQMPVELERGTFCLLMFEQAVVQGNCRPFPAKCFPCGTNVSRRGRPHQMQRQSSAGTLPEDRSRGTIHRDADGFYLKAPNAETVCN
ncbi:hypothetical protein E2320_000368, partial [Naja naja]